MKIDPQAGDVLPFVQTYYLDAYTHHQKHGLWPWEDPSVPTGRTGERIVRHLELTVYWIRRDGSFQVIDGGGIRYDVDPSGNVRAGYRTAGTVRLDWSELKRRAS